MRVASGYAVTGFVRNLADGRVQMLLEGDLAEVELCLSELCERMSGHVQDVEKAMSEATGEFTSFQVERW